ncbi:copper amine oxidase [Paenibacillus sp. P96]|uniref:Copper amine oxidase n=1 Tax=Paenibacillus zeirhizosphaerae TaxID=2987519 RepID=A0ABT9FNQ5_9BACL|nr:copper amine oxidase [Paenibacillus sp. P96]MDP4096131.1 copper amine oxidase [Paenibacillus sp. P96]
MLRLLAALLLSAILTSSSPLPAAPALAPEPDQRIATAPEDASVQLYSGPLEGGRFQKAILQVAGRFQAYDWTGSAADASPPQLYVQDVNQDGVHEAVVILTAMSGTGTEIQNIHVVNLESLEEYSVEDAGAFVQKQVSSKVSAEDGQHPVEIEVTFRGQRKLLEMSPADFYDNPSNFNAALDFTSYIVYDTSLNELRAIVSGSVSPSEFVGDLELTYKFEDGRFLIDQVTFVPYE